MITVNVFGSRRCNEPRTQSRISSDLFGSCLSFRGCRTSLREPPGEPTVGLDTWESHPGFIITLHNTQWATSGSAQVKVKVMETIFPPSRRDVAWRSVGGDGGGGGGWGGDWLWLQHGHGKRNMEKSWKWSMSIHRGDKQTKQEFGGQDDDFGNHDLTHCPSLTYDTHTHGHTQRNNMR